MNRKSWLTKQIAKYSLTTPWRKAYRNHATHRNFNKPLQFHKPPKGLLHGCIKKRFSSDASCSKDSGDRSIGRHEFHKELEEIMNEQALEEYKAAYAYLSMALHFGQTSIALPGCQGFFMNMYEEELCHGTVFLNYVLMRGGKACLKNISVPTKTKYDVREAFHTAMEMEMHIKEKLCCVNDVAEKHKDLQVMDLLATEFMEEQNRSICEMGRLYTRSKMVNTPVGEHLFDQFVFRSFVATEKENLMGKRNLELEKANFNVYR